MVIADGTKGFESILGGLSQGVEEDLRAAMRQHPHPGWKELADHVRLSHHEQSWRADFGEHHTRAMDLEFGTLDAPPVPVIRPFLHAKGHDIDRYLGDLVARALCL